MIAKCLGGLRASSALRFGSIKTGDWSIVLHWASESELFGSRSEQMVMDIQCPGPFPVGAAFGAAGGKDTGLPARCFAR